jgi:adenine C2-methylase RlmN of 23S rRNA A2503 and tRNA A37
MNKDLKDKTPAELERIVTELGGKKFLAAYIFSFIHTKNAGAISDITPLSKAFREKLSEQGYYREYVWYRAGDQQAGRRGYQAPPGDLAQRG